MRLREIPHQTKALASLAVIHNRAYGGGNGPFTEGVSALSGPSFNVQAESDPGGIVPLVSVADLFGCRLIAFNGLDAARPLHTAALLHSWDQGGSGRIYGFPQGHIDTARGIWEEIESTLGPLGARDLILGGHSYGGYWSLLFAALPEVLGGGRAVEIFTYGMPKVMFRRDEADYHARHRRHYRYLRTGDVVPNLPPLPEESWSARAIHAFTPNWQHFVHESRAIDTAEGVGHETSVWSTTPQAGEFGFNVPLWLTETIRGAESTHGAPRYWADLRQFYSWRLPVQMSNDDRSPAPITRGAPAQTVSKADLERLERRATADYDDAARAHESVRIPNIWSWQKVPGGYGVFLHGVTQTTLCRKKSTARAIVNRLNAVGRFMGKSVDIDQTAFGEAAKEMASEIEGHWEQ